MHEQNKKFLKKKAEEAAQTATLHSRNSKFKVKIVCREGSEE